MKNAGLVVLALALLAGSVFAYRHFSREQRQSQDFPEGAHWLCSRCNQGFTVTLVEVNQWASSDPTGGYPCPKCKATETARICPQRTWKRGAFYGESIRLYPTSQCGARMGRLPSDLIFDNSTSTDPGIGSPLSTPTLRGEVR